VVTVEGGRPGSANETVYTFPLPLITIPIALQDLQDLAVSLQARCNMMKVIKDIETSISPLQMACPNAKEQQPKLNTGTDLKTGYQNNNKSPLYLLSWRQNDLSKELLLHILGRHTV
jgi:hypothetical protein